MRESRRKKNKNIYSGLNREFRNFVRAVRCATGTKRQDATVGMLKDDGASDIRPPQAKRRRLSADDDEFPPLEEEGEEEEEGDNTTPAPVTSPSTEDKDGPEEEEEVEEKMSQSGVTTHQQTVQTTTTTATITATTPAIDLTAEDETEDFLLKTEATSMEENKAASPAAPMPSRYSLRRLGLPPINYKKKKKKGSSESGEGEEEEDDDEEEEENEEDEGGSNNDDEDDSEEDDEDEDDEEDEEEDEEEEDDIVGGLVFEIPDEKQGFFGITHKSTCWVQPTSSCIVQLMERPFLVLPYADIELACLERVGYNPPLKVLPITSRIFSSFSLYALAFWYGIGAKGLSWTNRFQKGSYHYSGHTYSILGSSYGITAYPLHQILQDCQQLQVIFYIYIYFICDLM